MLLFLILGCEMMSDHLGTAAEPNNHTEIVFEVKKGASARSLGPELATAKVINNAENFTNYVRITKEGGCIKAGRFKLSRAMTAKQILETLCGVPLHNDKPFAVLEGWRIREIDAALAKDGWIKAGEYAKLANSPQLFKAPFELPKDTLEGYLYPETYMLTPDRFDPKEFIQRQLDLLTDNFYTPNQAAIAKSGHSFSDIMIVASMVEREEKKEERMPMVSGIIWKRLRCNWRLGIDATSHYTLANWNDPKGLLKKLRDESDPYNTRTKTGLPPTAIGSPSITALQATLFPEATDYWYYLHDLTPNVHWAVTNRCHVYNKRYLKKKTTAKKGKDGRVELFLNGQKIGKCREQVPKLDSNKCWIE